MKQVTKTLDILIDELGDQLLVKTTGQLMSAEEIKRYVDLARSKSLNDFQIAGIIWFDGKPIRSLIG